MGPGSASVRVRAAPAQRRLISRPGVNAGKEAHEVRSRRIQSPAGVRGFEREAHHDVSGGERVAGEPFFVVELLLQIIEMKFYLAVDVSARRPAEEAKPADSELQQQGRHERAFGVMQPIAIAPSGFIALRRRQSLAISSDKVVDDRAGFGEAQRTILDDRRLSQRVDGPQARGGEHRLRVPLVTNDFVVEPDLFEKPQDALRARIVEVMDFDQDAYSDRNVATLARFDGSGRAIKIRLALYRARPARAA